MEQGCLQRKRENMHVNGMKMCWLKLKGTLLDWIRMVITHFSCIYSLYTGMPFQHSHTLSIYQYFLFVNRTQFRPHSCTRTLARTAREMKNYSTGWQECHAYTRCYFSTNCHLRTLTGAFLCPVFSHSPGISTHSVHSVNRFNECNYTQYAVLIRHDIWNNDRWRAKFRRILC